MLRGGAHDGVMDCLRALLDELDEELDALVG